MKNRCKQLTLGEKYQIATLYAHEFSARKIAFKLNRSNKTISTELARCIPLRRLYLKHYSSKQPLQITKTGNWT